MAKIEITVPDGTSNEWSVQSFTVEPDDFSQRIAMMKTGRGVPAGNYKRLMRNGTCVMSNTPDEIRDFYGFVRYAKGKILVNGLGLGVLLKALLDKEEVTEIIVIEKSADVIKLVGSTITDKRVTIINADAFEYKPTKGETYDCVWHDIWDYITEDNLPEMAKLHRKYGRRTEYQESWCKSDCQRYKRQNQRSYW